MPEELTKKSTTELVGVLQAISVVIWQEDL